jgi:hypothetical protein
VKKIQNHCTLLYSVHVGPEVISNSVETTDLSPALLHHKSAGPDTMATLLIEKGIALNSSFFTPII